MTTLDARRPRPAALRLSLLLGLALLAPAAHAQEIPRPPGDPPPPAAPDPAPAGPGGHHLDAFRESMRLLRDLAPPPAPRSLPLAANPALDEAQAACTLARQFLAEEDGVGVLRETARAIAAYPAGSDAYQIRAELYGRRWAFAHAVATLTDAIAACPGEPILWTLRGYYRCAGRDPGGRDDFDQAARLGPDPSAAPGSLRLWRASGDYALGDHRRCVDGLADLAAADFDDVSGLAERGDAYRHLGDHERAIADLEWAVIRDPAPAYRRLLGLARGAAGQFAAGLGDLERATAAGDDDPSARCLVGLLRLAHGRRDDGLAVLDQLLKEDPTDALVQAGRGWAFLLAGDLAAAHPLLRRSAGQVGGRLTVQINLAANPWAHFDADADWATAEFAARCRAAPALPWAVILRTGEAARRRAVPRPIASLAFVSRLVPDPGVGPSLVVQVNARYRDQPWRGVAVLGEFVAAAGLRDRAKVAGALHDLGGLLRGQPGWDAIRAGR